MDMDEALKFVDEVNKRDYPQVILPPAAKRLAAASVYRAVEKIELQLSETRKELDKRHDWYDRGLQIMALELRLKKAESQVRDLKAVLATIVGEAANLDEAVLIANRALGPEGVENPNEPWTQEQKEALAKVYDVTKNALKQKSEENNEGDVPSPDGNKPSGATPSTGA